MTVTPSAARAEREAQVAALPFIEVGAPARFFVGSWSSIREIWLNRQLLGRLVGREIKARYKDSSLGIVWSLFRPLAQLLIYYFAIGQVLGAARAVPDFAVFVFIGLTMWTLASEIISGTTSSIVSNAGLVKKVAVPREIYPLSTVGSAFVNFGIQFVVLIIGALLLARIRVSWDLLLLPLAIALIVVFCTAVGLMLAALNVYFRDIQHLIEIGLIVFFWASPIVYPFTFVNNVLQGGWLEQLYLSNPITLAILGAQRALWAAGVDNPVGQVQAWPDELAIRMLVALALSGVLLWLGQRLFARLQGNFAQEL